MNRGTSMKPIAWYDPTNGAVSTDKDSPLFTPLGQVLPLYLQPEQEPVAWVDLQKEAQQIVESKVLWKRFIDGTPLANDIACWMADFAQQHTTPPQRKPLTDEEIHQLDPFPHIMFDQQRIDFARAIEAAHGIKGEA